MAEPKPRPINLAESGMDMNGNFAIRQPEASNVGLMERLDQLIQEESEKYPTESVGKVKQLVQYEIENLGKPKPYRSFSEIYDFLLYRNLHPEWQGRPLREKETGANSFYQAFSRWVKKTARNRMEEKRLLNI